MLDLLVLSQGSGGVITAGTDASVLSAENNQLSQQYPNIPDTCGSACFSTI
jgi:hypothetical protein